MAEIQDVTFYRGTRYSDDHIAYDKPLDIGASIWELAPQKNKFLTWALAQGRMEAKSRRQYHHLESAPFPMFVVYNGADEAVQATTGLVFKAGAGARLALGSRIRVNRTGEIIYFTADFATTTTSAGATRCFGVGVSTNYLKKGDTCTILPPAQLEGYTVGKGFSGGNAVETFNMTQVSYPVEMSDIEEAEAAYGGDPFLRQLKKNWQKAKNELEAELLLGAVVSDTTTFASPVGASEGIMNWADVNVYTAEYLSRMDLWDILTEVKTRAGVDNITIVCSSAFKTMVTNWGFPLMKYEQGTVYDGANIQYVKTPIGDFTMLDVPLLGNDPYLIGEVFLCPDGQISYTWLEGNGKNLDVRYTPVPVPTIHKTYGEITGVRGFELWGRETWGRISGLRFANAA